MALHQQEERNRLVAVAELVEPAAVAVALRNRLAELLDSLEALAAAVGLGLAAALAEHIHLAELAAVAERQEQGLQERQGPRPVERNLAAVRLARQTDLF